MPINGVVSRVQCLSCRTDAHVRYIYLKSFRFLVVLTWLLKQHIFPYICMVKHNSGELQFSNRGLCHIPLIEKITNGNDLIFFICSLSMMRFIVCASFVDPSRQLSVNCHGSNLCLMTHFFFSYLFEGLLD